MLIALTAACAHDRPRATEARPSFQALVRGDRWEHLQPVKASIGSRDFEGAIRAYQQLLDSPGGTRHADLVLFDLGLLYAHSANPGRDYQRSLASFTRLIKEHPRSPLAEEARIWADVLEMLERAKQVDLELEQKKKALIE